MKRREELVKTGKERVAVDYEVADDLQKLPCKCVVVTIREIDLTHCDDVDTVVFSDWDKANVWVESQIESQVHTFGLNRESAVDGWFVEIDSLGHTIQYDAKERVIK